MLLKLFQQQEISLDLRSASLKTSAAEKFQAAKFIEECGTQSLAKLLAFILNLIKTFSCLEN